MGQVAVTTREGKAAEPLELADQFTEAPYNPFLIRDAVVYQQAKERQGTHAVKSRSQVSGSRRKLYRQKGTGYARAGDRKAAQRRGGGIVHGPVPRSHSIKLNKKVRKAALRIALAERLRQGTLQVLDSVEPPSHKTKEMAAWLAEREASQALIVTHEIGPNLALAARNLPGVAVLEPGQVNTYNLLLFDKALITREALLTLQERLTT